MIFRNPEHDLIATNFQLPLTLETTPERVVRAHQAHQAVARRLSAGFVAASFLAALGYSATARGAHTLIAAGAVVVVISACGLIMARAVRHSEIRARQLLGIDGVQVMSLDKGGVTIAGKYVPHERIAYLRGIIDADEKVAERRLYRDGVAHTASIAIGITAVGAGEAAARNGGETNGDATNGGAMTEIRVPFDAYLEREALDPFLSVARQVSAQRYEVSAVRA